MKLYVCSDIHGYFDEFKKALDEMGFDPSNDEHLLVVCGDTTDRGSQPLEVISYLSKLIDENKCVVIKGNHEQLVIDCLNRKYPGSHDFSNGTFDTICDLGGAKGGRPFDECCIVANDRFKPFVNKMVNYFETNNYVFVHGWIPVNCYDGLPAYYRHNRKFLIKDDWRFAHQKEWDDAMWLCGPNMARHGFNNTGKTIVFGHWHTSYLWAIKEGRSEFDEDAKFDPFFGDGYIAIDGCTAHTGKVNVIVLEDELLKENANA